MRWVTLSLSRARLALQQASIAAENGKNPLMCKRAAKTRSRPRLSDGHRRRYQSARIHYLTLPITAANVIPDQVAKKYGGPRRNETKIP
jgi:hypothetical protein